MSSLDGKLSPCGPHALPVSESSLYSIIPSPAALPNRAARASPETPPRSSPTAYALLEDKLEMQFARLSFRLKHSFIYIFS